MSGKNMTARLTELRVSLENLARLTTVNRPLSPLYLKEAIEGHVTTLNGIIRDTAEGTPTTFLPPPPPHQRDEPKKGSKPPDGKPV